MEIHGIGVMVLCKMNGRIQIGKECRVNPVSCYALINELCGDIRIGIEASIKCRV